jgi:UDP-2,3-diacylglucosamine pyrophosphatase LpxH
MRTVILGDIHLGSPLCRTAQLRGVLEKVPLDRLVLNGDIFDDLNFRRLKPRHWEVLKEIRALAERGCEVVWIFGNHDGSAHALERLLGVEVHPEFSFTFRGEKVLVLHGHEFDKFHHATRGLNTLRGYFYGFALWFDVPRKTAIQWVQRSSTIFERAARRVKERALAKAKARGARYIVVGHTHHREEDHEGGITFMNPSSWLTSQPAYVLFDDDEERPELVVLGRRPHRPITDALRARVKVTGRRVSRRISR